MRCLIDDNTIVLIVGTYPGERSLKENHYYMDPRNQFWKIMTRILRDEVHKIDIDLFETDPDTRENILLENKIGLWDAIAKAERKGSLDKNTIDGNHNDKGKILKEHPDIIFVPNGRNAFNWILKNPVDEHFDRILAVFPPSTSGTNTHYTLDEKTELWKKRLDIFQLW